MNYVHECPVCGHENTFDVTPPTRDVYYLRNGDPGYPGDPADINGPEECEECLEPFDLDKVLEKALEHMAEADHDSDAPDRREET